MGCLTFCRWCCCCFLATINVLTTIMGIGFFVLGCIIIWGYWILRQATEKAMNDFNDAVRKSKMDVNIDLESIHGAIESLLATTAIIFLVLGAVLIIISCLGCYGACLGVPACLIIYAVIVGLVFLAQASLVIAYFVDSNMMKRCARNSLETKVANYKGLQGMDTGTLQMDILQYVMGCCGVDGGNDYYRPGSKWNRTVRISKDTGEKRDINMTYPYSCCKMSNTQSETEKCISSNATSLSNYNVGCYEKLVDIMDTKLKLNNLFHSLAGSLGIDALLIIGALVIYFHKRQQQADIPHSNVQYKMTPQMA